MQSHEQFLYFGDLEVPLDEAYIVIPLRNLLVSTLSNLIIIFIFIFVKYFYFFFGILNSLFFLPFFQHPSEGESPNLGFRPAPFRAPFRG